MAYGGTGGIEARSTQGDGETVALGSELVGEAEELAQISGVLGEGDEAWREL